MLYDLYNKFSLLNIDLNKNVDSDFNRDLLNFLIENEIPFKIINIDLSKISKDEILRTLFRSNEQIQISVSENLSFSGAITEHNQINMNLDNYLQYDGSLHLYLGQINLIENQMLNDVIKVEYLKNLLPYCARFNRINVWHSQKNTISKFHFDSYQNFLTVLKGKKIVLLAPNNTTLIIPHNFGESSSNQAKIVSSSKINNKFQRFQKMRILNKEIFINHHMNTNYGNFGKIEGLLRKYKDLLNFISKSFLLKLTVNENEILYIPEGWWHQVYTYGNNNLAINFWWNRIVNDLNNNKELFLISQSLNSLTEKYIKQINYSPQNQPISIIRNLIDLNKRMKLIEYIKSLNFK